MRRINLLFIFCVGMSIAVMGNAQTFYAHFKNDTLCIGNSRIERSFCWNSGQLVSLKLTDKTAGSEIVTKAAVPDFLLVKGTPDSAYFSQSVVPSNGIHPAYLNVSVYTRFGKLEIERRYRVYDNCSAIACDTYLRGRLDMATKTAQGITNVDRKNIESTDDMNVAVKTPTLDRLQLCETHWKVRTVEFFDYTDWNDNLVVEREWVPYRRNGYRGNLLMANHLTSNRGFFFLKEAPCSSTQLHYTGNDFIADFNDFMVVGTGVTSTDITPHQWTRLYGCVTGIFTGGEKEALLALRGYQKQLRSVCAEQDNMIMLNTWGDRSQDARINEQFCLEELDQASQLGISVFQLDDGWQSGKSPNSKSKGGSFNNIWKDNMYWTPNRQKFPHGLTPIVEKGRKKGIDIGLWFNPSIQDDFADWKKDAEAIVGLYKTYGIRHFKIDGLQIPTKKAEENLRRLFDTVLHQTDGNVIFNLDATAGRRGGYHFFNEYGNIFLENRYTDWGNYYPYRTLRNLWQLSKYVPAEKLQIEFLNKWRNIDKYPDNDRFAPSCYSFDYLFAICMVAQPLAWMEASNLPSSAYTTARLVKKYQTIQRDIHEGTILPIGNEPDGSSWTGFQSIKNPTEGYFIVYRENNDEKHTCITTWMKANQSLRLKLLTGSGADFECITGKQGEVEFNIPEKNDFSVYKYQIIR